MERYSNVAEFDGPGTWAGSLPEGHRFLCHAENTRLGGVFDARYRSWGASRDFLVETSSADMTVRFATTSAVEVLLDFSASMGPSGFGDVTGNAGLEIVNANTGLVAFDMFRDGAWTLQHPYLRTWEEQTWSGVLDPGVYEVRSYARVIYTFGGGNGTYSGHSDLTFDLNFFSIPTPGAPVILGWLLSRHWSRRTRDR